MRQTVVFPPCRASGGTNVKEAVTEAMSALKSGANHDVAKGATAGAEELVLGNDPRLSDARRASDVSDWAKAPKKPKYTAEEVGAAELRHTHEPATINHAGFMTAEDKKLLTALASDIKGVSKVDNNEIKQLPDGLYVKTPSWTNKEW